MISRNKAGTAPVIDQLADAYRHFFATDGQVSGAREAIAVASKKLDSSCPGAAS